MIFELFAFFGIIIVLLALAAELGKKPFLGIAAGVLLLVLAFWVLLDGLQMQQGTSIRQNQTMNTSSITITNITMFAKAQRCNMTGGFCTMANPLIKNTSMIFCTYLNCSSCGTIYISGINQDQNYSVSSTNSSDSSELNCIFI